MASSIDRADLLKRLRGWTGFERGSKITAREAADEIELLHGLLKRVMQCDKNANILNGARDLREDIRSVIEGTEK